MNFLGYEEDGSVIKPKWMDTSYFEGNPGLLVPPELMEILKRVIEK